MQEKDVFDYLQVTDDELTRVMDDIFTHLVEISPTKKPMADEKIDIVKYIIKNKIDTKFLLILASLYIGDSVNDFFTTLMENTK